MFHYNRRDPSVSSIIGGIRKDSKRGFVGFSYMNGTNVFDSIYQ